MLRLVGFIAGAIPSFIFIASVVFPNGVLRLNHAQITVSDIMTIAGVLAVTILGGLVGAVIFETLFGNK